MKYKYLKCIGKGSFGNVYTVKKYGSESKIYALKHISTHGLSSKDKENLINEIRVLKYSKCPFLISFFDCEYSNLYINIVTQYANKGDLLNYINNHSLKNPIHENKIWCFIIQVSLGLSYLHSNNIIHRDIKAANIFLGENYHIYIGDLGICKVFTNSKLTEITDGEKRCLTDTQIGTPLYMGPELFKKEEYGKKIDIWALGCLLFELITLEPPFCGKNMKDLARNIMNVKFETKIDSFNYSDSLKELVLFILIKDVSERPTIERILEREDMQNKMDLIPCNSSFKDIIKKIDNFEEKFKKIPHRDWFSIIKFINNDEYLKHILLKPKKKPKSRLNPISNPYLYNVNSNLNSTPNSNPSSRSSTPLLLPQIEKHKKISRRPSPLNIPKRAETPTTVIKPGNFYSPYYKKHQNNNSNQNRFNIPNPGPVYSREYGYGYGIGNPVNKKRDFRRKKSPFITKDFSSISDILSLDYKKK